MQQTQLLIEKGASPPVLATAEILAVTHTQQ